MATGALSWLSRLTQGRRGPRWPVVDRKKKHTDRKSVV